MHIVDAVSALAPLFVVVAAALVIIAVTAWIYMTVRIISHRKEIALAKKVKHAVIGVIGGLMIFIPTFFFSYTTVTWYIFKEHILSQYPFVEEVLISGYRERFDISFYADLDAIPFDIAEEIFQLTLEKLKNQAFFNAIKIQHMLRRTFEMSSIEIQFFGTDSKISPLHEFETFESDNYNKWKVIYSREPEHRNKKYYFDIAPEPQVSSDIGSSLI